MPLADTLASPLIGAYAEVWDGLVGELETLTDPGAWRRRERIRELLTTIDAQFRGLEPAVRQFTDRDLKDVYGLGHSWGATTAGVQGVFAIQYNETLGALESGLRDRLLAENRAASELMQRQVRDAARTATRSSVVAGTPAQAAARQMTETLRGSGLHSVTYNDGSRRSIKTYSEMAVRTTTAQAYNEGSFELGKQIGVQFYEVFDGPTCGWTFHEDTDFADGKIVTDDEARAWPISHPNCRRSFGARPDLTERPDGKVEHRISPPTSAEEARERARLEAGGLLRERRRTGRRANPGQPRAAAAPEPAGIPDPGTKIIPPSPDGKYAVRKTQGPYTQHARGTADELDALHQYTEFGTHYEVNSALRAGKPPPADLTRKLDSVTTKNVLGEDRVLFRGTSDPALRQQLEKAKPGTKLTDKGFTSTTIDSKHIEAFQELGDAKDAVTLRINAPSDTRGAFIGNQFEDRAGFFDQAEFLMARGTELVVEKTFYVGEKLYVTARVVRQGVVS